MEIEKMLTQYLEALEKGSYQDVMNLFSENAVVTSPLYGRVRAAQFYKELLKDTTKSKITVLNLFTNKSETVGAAHFLYEWMLKNRTVTSFECVDVVEFSCNGKIDHLTIIYDTHETRQAFEKMKMKTKE